MNLQTLSQQLADAGSRPLQLLLPSGDQVPAHFHITEVGKVTKDFVDCGGVRHTEESCVLQTLVAHDKDHRLSASKLLQILKLTDRLGLSPQFPVDFEIQGDTVQIFSLTRSHMDSTQLTLLLGAKRTACLAPDQCGIGTALPTLGESCCGDSGCC